MKIAPSVTTYSRCWVPLAASAANVEPAALSASAAAARQKTRRASPASLRRAVGGVRRHQLAVERGGAKRIGRAVRVHVVVVGAAVRDAREAERGDVGAGAGDHSDPVVAGRQVDGSREDEVVPAALLDRLEGDLARRSEEGAGGAV